MHALTILITAAIQKFYGILQYIVENQKLNYQGNHLKLHQVFCTSIATVYCV